MKKIEKLVFEGKKPKLVNLLTSKPDGSNLKDICKIYDSKEDNFVIMKDIKGRLFGAAKMTPPDKGDDNSGTFDIICFDLEKNLIKKANNEADSFYAFKNDGVGKLEKALRFSAHDESKIEESLIQDITSQGLKVELKGKNLCYGVSFIEIDEDAIDDDEDEPNGKAKLKEVIFVIESIEIFSLKI